MTSAEVRRDANVFRSAVDFISGDKPKPRQTYTAQREANLQTRQSE
ncbi:hypothetical protein [Neisseria animaloris]|nr:hypothetical protein [Neisseria animaloris]